MSVHKTASRADAASRQRTALKREADENRERGAAGPGRLSPRDVLRLQRMAGNRAVAGLMARRAPQLQRAVSHSASWPAPGGSPEATLLGQLDAQIPAAEAAGANAVQSVLGYKTPRQANYIQQPSAATWGCVVEEQLDPLAVGLGWSTQHRLAGARPDYHRLSNGIELFVDLTSSLQAGIGGNHITGKLQNAGYNSPDATVAAADVTHASTNPHGGGPGQVVLGNASPSEMAAFQQYDLFAGINMTSRRDVGFNPLLEAIVKRYGKVKHHRFTTKWSARKRDKFREKVEEALMKPATVNFKQHRTRSHTKRQGF